MRKREDEQDGTQGKVEQNADVGEEGYYQLCPARLDPSIDVEGARDEREDGGVEVGIHRGLDEERHAALRVPTLPVDPDLVQ